MAIVHTETEFTQASMTEEKTVTNTIATTSTTIITFSKQSFTLFVAA